MGVVFLGDVSLSPGADPALPSGFPSFDSPAVANLEGPILDLAASTSGVWNSPIVLGFLARCHVRAVTLANNHITDLGAQLSDTRARLDKAGIGSFGAGSTRAEAATPLLLEAEGVTVALLGFGWDVIGCLPPRISQGGVNLLRPAQVIAAVADLRRSRPTIHIAVFMHWNYEGEIYPQPAHRQLAFAAIEAGADAVVGCHPHCVQGIEFHRGAPIAYSLGNWFLPWGSFWGGELAYPDFMRRQLAFEWDPRSGSTICHWYEYEPSSHALHFLGQEPAVQSAAVHELTPFAGMSHRDYKIWFRGHRRKRRLLPVYDDMDDDKLNFAKDRLVISRQKLIDAAVRLGLKGGPR